ncbi:HAMP domain-containing histidine kinase [Paenibacillus zeisoli]|uniref:Heme sensor protein HssS n=1 Tax=Paenibacillus zeisoli TaxID=2496267 RepID=A0A433XPN5_9BACL|nr:HAMP domain-containing sensor histidine kinase [Paenibacillus zeisoli]RUT35994.1 HAMP domain-containing histidine kinase [Paenibacillus zeisoli]
MRSLYYRVFLITIATVIISSLMGFLVSNIYYHMKLKPFNDQKLVTMASNMKNFAESHPQLSGEYFENAASLGYELLLISEGGEERSYGSAFREKDLARESLKLVLGGQVYHGVSNFPNSWFITGFFDNRLSNTIGMPLTLNGGKYALFMRPDVLLQFGELRNFFAMIGGLTIAFSVLAMLISTTYLVKPITRLTEATKRIAQGTYDIQIPVRRRDEIGQLAAHFMSMSKELERADLARQEFVANVSHEIQSPLTSIQGFAKALTNKALPKEEYEHYVKIINEESHHLSLLSKQLLLLSSLDQTADGLQKKAFNLRSQLRQVVQVMQWQMADREIALRFEVPEEIQVNGDEVLLYQVWMNLLSNAVKHIPEGRSIDLRAGLRQEGLVITVSDTGDGIPEDQLPLLFDRFYRVDPARERASGSTGLGLAIVKKIILLHEGNIEVSSSKDGTTFTVTLPKL